MTSSSLNDLSLKTTTFKLLRTVRPNLNPGYACHSFQKRKFSMLDDVDRAMKQAGLSAIVVYGETTLGNPELMYVARTIIPRIGIYVKKLKQEPFLVVSNLDVGHARRGIVRDVRTLADYKFMELARKHGMGKALVYLLDRILKKEKIRGKISLYGRNDMSQSLFLASTLRKKGHRVIGSMPPTLLDRLRSTKDDWELERIREVGRKTIKIVEKIRQLLLSCDIRDGRLFKEGEALTVGMVKETIRLLVAREELVLPEGVIFAAGPKSADPHYMGMKDDIIREGEPIVFDIFPQAEDGYWYDFTRTWTVGRANPTLLRMYEVTLRAQEIALEHIVEGKKARDSMREVCDHFGKLGYLTPRDLQKGNRRAESHGFTHSLGHGLGLTIGEQPNLGLFSTARLESSNVVTVEPGLYDPSIGGVRIEDVAVVRKSRPEIVVEYPKDLVPER